MSNVIRAARDLGISTPMPNEATIALGTANVSLLELTAAYAAIAAGDYPVQRAGARRSPAKGLAGAISPAARTRCPSRIQGEMRDLLAASVADGTSRQAALSVDTFGKTGTTQDSRDALFVGFADGLVVRRVGRQ